MDRYRFIFVEKAFFPVVVLCVVLKVSRSGYGSWCKRNLEQQDQSAPGFDEEVAAVWDATSGRYGSWRIHAELQARSISCSRSRVARSMRRQGLIARRRRRFRATTDSAHNPPIAPNLLERNSTASTPNEVWTGDITSVETAEGWLYLAVLMDLYSRRIVGWAMSNTIDRHLTLDALRMAVGTRRPPKGLLHHTDRGSQYASRDYRKALERAGFRASMSRKGDCWDNAPTVSFFASIKVEELHHKRFATRDQARTTILRYIAWYNAARRHSTLNNLSPVAYETNSIPLPMAA